jgi:hypothetical protein
MLSSSSLEPNSGSDITSTGISEAANGSGSIRKTKYYASSKWTLLSVK